MFDEELTSKFPEEGLLIPKYHGPSNPKELEGDSLMLIQDISTKGWVTIQTRDTSFRVEKESDFLKLFPQKFNWTYSRFGEIHSLFKCFSKRQLQDLYYLGEFEFGNHQVYWIIGTDKIRITENRNPRTSKYLTNTARYLYKEEYIRTLEDLQLAVDKLIELNQLLGINLMSPASTAKDLILDGNKKEFTLFNKLPQTDLRFIHSCYKGPRMESRLLGTIENASNMDMVKAYLKALALCPSLSNENLLIIERSKRYNPDAHPGSGYHIRVNVPKEYSTFTPIPVRKNGLTLYGHGEFTTYVSKSYVEDLIDIGDVPFEILDSVQFILRRKDYPFKHLAKMLDIFERGYEEKFYPVNIKFFHYAIVGHFLHFHPEVNKRTGEISNVASQDYHPVNACAIQGMVARDIWRLSQVQDTEAIRVDAITGYNLPKKKHFRSSPSGLMTFLTPSLKDKPGSTMYRDLITTYRDKPYVEFFVPRRVTINMTQDPHQIGRLIDTAVRVPPTGGNRKIDKVRQIGELLGGRIGTTIPSVDEDIEGGQTYPWIDEYLRLFLHSQT